MRALTNNDVVPVEEKLIWSARRVWFGWTDFDVDHLVADRVYWPLVGRLEDQIKASIDESINSR